MICPFTLYPETWNFTNSSLEFFPVFNRRQGHRICCSLTWNKAKELAGWIGSPGGTSWQTHVHNKRFSLSSRILAGVVGAYTPKGHFSLQPLLQRSTCRPSVHEYLVWCKTLQTASVFEVQARYFTTFWLFTKLHSEVRQYRPWMMIVLRSATLWTWVDTGTRHLSEAMQECSTEQKHRLSSALTKVSLPLLSETTFGND